MNVLYMIGNGFDLNLNYKTSYKSFLDHYLNLKKEIKQKLLSYGNLSQEESIKLEQNIYVVFNSGMFKIKTKEEKIIQPLKLAS